MLNVLNLGGGKAATDASISLCSPITTQDMLRFTLCMKAKSGGSGPIPGVRGHCLEAAPEEEGLSNPR